LKRFPGSWRGFEPFVASNPVLVAELPTLDALARRHSLDEHSWTSL